MIVLCPVAGIGAALSFQSLHEAALPIFGRLAFGFPLLVDMLILGSTLAFLAGATHSQALPGWRWTAHGGVAGTLLLNALAASSPATVPWHITPALVWSVLVEMTARHVTGNHPSLPTTATGPIPARLWISQPLDTTRTWLHMARTGQSSYRQARTDLAVHAAAAHALKAAMPRHRQRDARRFITHQLRAGALDPATLLSCLHRQQHFTAEHPTALVIHAFLTNDETFSPEDVSQQSNNHPPAPAPRQPGTSVDEIAAPNRPNTRRPNGLEDRSRVAVQILQAQPECDGAQMRLALAEHGWKTSSRNARRILAQAHRELAPG